MSGSQPSVPDPAWHLIDTQNALDSAAEALASGEGPVGIDAERASGFRYGSEAYLVQASRRGAGTFLFDPTGIASFAPLAEALSDTEWVLHAASQDIPCLTELGLQPKQLFDTELASRLLGLERVGLGAVVESLLGVHLEKAHSASDWSRRPLPDSWLEYAALDVALLPDLREQILSLLERAGKTEIARQEFQALLTTQKRASSGEPWRKTSGIHRLRSPRQLAVVRELWLARDQLAQQKDLAPGRLIPDRSVIAAAEALPRSRDELARLKSFSGRASRTELNRWWLAVRRGRQVESLPPAAKRDPAAMPHHRSWPERYPKAARRLAEARAALATEAERLSIPQENLITPELVRKLAWDPPERLDAERIDQRLLTLGARDWQRVLTAPIIARAFVDSL